MGEQVFQLTTQYKYAVLRVICFSFLSFILFFLIIIVMVGIFPVDWRMPLFMLSTIPLIIFLDKYTKSIGKYEVTLKIDLEAMRIAPLFEEYNEKIYLWADLKEFRLITFPPSPGFNGVVYIKWQDGDSHHFSGQDLDDFYHYLQFNFPKKEWSFLGRPKKPFTH